LFRWVQRFTPLIVDAVRPCRHTVGGRWFVDETYVKVAGTWRYVYRAVDQHRQVIDVYVSAKRDVKAATRSFSKSIRVHGAPAEVTTDRSPALARSIVELLRGRAQRDHPVRTRGRRCERRARLGGFGEPLVQQRPDRAAP